MRNILKLNLLIISFMFCITLSNAQNRRGEYNMFGIKLGGALFDIKTDNFTTSSDFGFIGGLATRGNFYNNWDIQFGINLGNNNLKIQGRETLSSEPEYINYSLLNAQVHLLFGYKIIGNQRNMRSDFKLTFETGPVLMINGKMKYGNARYDLYRIDGTNLTAEQIQDVNGINFNGLVGLSMGMERFRVFGHYQYGFNNILSKLNKVDGNTESFKGNVNLIQFGVLFYF